MADYPNIQPSGGDFSSMFEALRKEQDSSRGPLLSPAALLAKIPPYLLPRAGQSAAQPASGTAASSAGNTGGVAPGTDIEGVGTTQTQTTPFTWTSEAREIYQRIFNRPPPQTPSQDEINVMMRAGNPRGSEERLNAPQNQEESRSNVEQAYAAKQAAAQAGSGAVQSNSGGFDSGGLAALLSALAGGGGVGGGSSQLFPTSGGR